jgi:PTS hybrid protein
MLPAIRHCRIAFDEVGSVHVASNTTTESTVVGIVVVSHSPELARGVADLAGELAGSDVAVEAVGGGPDGRLGTDGERVRAAITRADSGDGVILLGDLGSAILTIRHVLESRAHNHARLVDAPLVEGTLAAAVCASAGLGLDDVAKAAEEARDARKL